jgi:DNA repair photolyase
VLFRSSTVEERFRVIREARAAGMKTSIMFGPLLPFLSDGPDSINGLLERAADLGIDTIWVDAMNPRPKVWEAVAALLRREYPDLLERYRRVLFSAPVRTAYVAGLHDRVMAAARRHHLEDRISVCS